MAKITASDIKDLLSYKHGKDIFVEECKDGPSSGSGGFLMMDAWAMKKSWANPCMYGYEIKVSRSDFLSDDKWPGYLPLCNEFYFVCPQGVIKPDELSKDVGLLIVAKTGTRLFKKKKAPHRIVEAPEGLLFYILMWRSRIVKNTYYAEREENINYWKRWLADKEAKLDLGTRCSRKLNKSFTEQVYEVQSKMKVMKSEIEQYKPVKELCKELKINPYTWRFEEAFREQVDNLRQLISPEILEACSLLENAIAQFKKSIEDKGKENITNG